MDGHDEQFAVRTAGCVLMGRVRGAGPAVMLLHGAGMDRAVFDDQVMPLVDAGFRVAVPDLRGHGRSRPSATAPSAGVLERDVLAVMDELGMDRAALVGQALGGAIAQGLARGHPERVSALAALGAAWNADRPTGPRPPGVLRRALPRCPTGRAALRRLADSSSTTPRGRALALRSLAALPAGLLRRTLVVVDEELGADPDQRVGVPTLLVCGAADAADVRASMRRWAAHDGLALHEIPGAGHLVTVDAPEEVTGLLLGLLTGALTGPGRS
ncbi:alpha/beta fold hydrolase [Propionibacterium acidifaciens]|uniref:alpha/beta fold hydrolase n=1 Tax=Propionibacterium acidifaciens TaxID=556499 RepID=UPI0023F4115B|nr:alpha/beta hydrolase [Propionibacterium acidifaciens]